jgi:hypothetical protein
MVPRSGDESSEPAWTPGTRDFRLQILLDPAADADPVARQELRALASGAIGFNAALGDSIEFGAVRRPDTPMPADEAPPAADGGLASHRAVATDSASDAPLDWIVAGLLILLGVACAYFIFRRRGGRRPMTAEQRAEFASRLQAALEQGERRAAA